MAFMERSSQTGVYLWRTERCWDIEHSRRFVFPSTITERVTMKKLLLCTVLASVPLAACSPTPTQSPATEAATRQNDAVVRDTTEATITNSDSSGRGPNTFGSGN